MTRACFVLVCCLLAGASRGLPAQDTRGNAGASPPKGRDGLARTSSAAQTRVGVGRGTTPSNLEAAAERRRPAGIPANRWRYRYSGGRWWYYHPNGQWSYWNGDAWMAYNRRPYGQGIESQVRPDFYGYGRRLPGTIQAEKNNSRAESSQSFDRPMGTIQAEKNDSRSEPFHSVESRPPGTIQGEKNNTRGRD
jgi:hypothetical protein